MCLHPYMPNAADALDTTSANLYLNPRYKFFR